MTIRLTGVRPYDTLTIHLTGARLLVSFPTGNLWPRTYQVSMGQRVDDVALPPSQRAGHVPTSLNVPWSKNCNDDGTFKSDADLKALYAEVGIDDSKDTIALCRIGERSSLTWFVLKELLGHQSVKNYDGSWTEYGSLVGVPVALGDEPGSPEGGAA